LLEPNLDYNYPIPKELAQNGIPFGAKSSGKVQLQSKLGLDLKDSEKTSLCVLNWQKKVQIQIQNNYSEVFVYNKLGTLYLIL